MCYMPIKYDIEIPERVIKALGLRESEVSETLKKELSVYFFWKKTFKFWSGKTISRVISMGLSGIFKRKENPFALWFGWVWGRFRNNQGIIIMPVVISKGCV